METRTLFERYYRSKPDYLGGTEMFHRLCAQNLHSGDRILEVGAGPTNSTTAFLASIGSVTGVDVSEEVHRNVDLRESYVCSGNVFPLVSQSFDLCVSNYVLEHVTDPLAHFQEAFRVLKPGAAYCFRTPNRWHYITIASQALPHSMHRRFANRLRALDSGAHDPWPTVYRANDRSQLTRTASERAGFTIERLEMVEKEPSYGAAHWTLFYPMMVYERLVNSSDIFRGLRANIFGTLRKPDVRSLHLPTRNNGR